MPDETTPNDRPIPYPVNPLRLPDVPGEPKLNLANKAEDARLAPAEAHGRVVWDAKWKPLAMVGFFAVSGGLAAATPLLHGAALIAAIVGAGALGSVGSALGWKK